MKIRRLAWLSTVSWSILIFIAAQALTFGVITRENDFLEANQIYVPPQPEVFSLWPQPTIGPSGEVTQTPVYESLGPILIYFFSVVIVLGIVLFLIPVRALRFLLRALFAFLFSWSVFVILVFWIPLPAALVIGIAFGTAWFVTPRVWLQNLVMVLAMVGVAAVFGRLISPWTTMALLLALAIYDFLAVRFGYMVWMAKKLSDSNTLPAFFIPKSISEWKNEMKESTVSKLVEEKSSDRKYSILGGGDIAFPLLLASSVYFAQGFYSALIVAIFSLVGLIGAYWIQAVFLKGKPMPALPPIAVLSLIGLLIVLFA
jgi:presenilin-like A22 family membrane protease